MTTLRQALERPTETDGRARFRPATPARTGTDLVISGTTSTGREPAPGPCGRPLPAKHRAPVLTARTVYRATIATPEPLVTATERNTGTVVLLAGSVGTGKTTLLATWAAQLARRGDRVGWATLGPEENDPDVLAETVHGALVAALDDALPRLAELQPASLPTHVFVAGLIDLLTAAPADTWLLLDDLHLVRDSRSRDLIDRVVRQASPRLHVVVATRADSGLHVARLRLEERLVEVRQEQLRFSLDDTRRFLESHDLALATEHVERLQTLTEGWPAGVALAAVSLSRGRDPETFLHEFASTDRAMSGYLVEEVLASVDERTRDFLLSTSVLEEMTPDLAAAVSGRDDAGELLAELSSDSAMVAADTVGTPTYRFHLLLRSYLSATLEARSLRRTREVHARAARWYSAHDGPSRALRHAEAAGDLDLVSDVLHHHALHLLLDGRGPDLDAALRVVEPGDPVLTALAALARLDLADPAAARKALASLQVPDSRDAPEEPGSAGGDGSGDTDATVDRLVAVGLRWLALLGGGDLSRASLAEETTSAGAPLAHGLAKQVLATFDAWSLEDLPMGRVPDGAERTADGSPAHAAPDGGSPVAAPVVQEPLDNLPHEEADLLLLDRLTSGGVLLGAGRLDEAHRAYTSALDAARSTRHPLPALEAMTGLATVCSAQEDLAGMTSWSERVLEESRDTPWATSPRLVSAHVLGAWAAFHRFDDDTARARGVVATGIIASALAAGPDGDLTADPDSVMRRGLQQLSRLARTLGAALDLAESVEEPGGRQSVAARVMADVREVQTLSMTRGLAKSELHLAHQLLLAAGSPRLALEVEDLYLEEPGGTLGDDGLAVLAALRHLRVGSDSVARRAVSSVLARGTSGLPLRLEVQARVVQSVLAHRNDQPTVAHEAFLTALAKDARHGGLRLVVGAAPDVLHVLRAGAGRFGELEQFAERLIEHRRRWALPVAARTDVALSARELSLLRELPSLLTVAEIAAARAVSPNTVKTQLRSLFQKLDVRSRRDAVAAARRLGLL
ncbi:AAA family ATPase [Terrabacter sp. 2RAF25]|uniref:AAA family ATPase n=1 Tax=Terrabacter sp. 2RAF25 TaxID=3232998 RepID=UPI003F95B5B9